MSIDEQIEDLKTTIRESNEALGCWIAMEPVIKKKKKDLLRVLLDKRIGYEGAT